MSRTLMTRWLMPPGVTASCGAAGAIFEVPSAIVRLRDFKAIANYRLGRLICQIAVKPLRQIFFPDQAHREPQPGPIAALHMTLDATVADRQPDFDVKRRAPVAEGVLRRRVVFDDFCAEQQRFLVGRIFADIVVAAVAAKEAVCLEHDDPAGSVPTAKRDI